MYEISSDSEQYEIDSFTSDDGNHLVEWRYSEELEYPTWICITHDKPYYRDCVTSSGASGSPLLQ